MEKLPIALISRTMSIQILLYSDDIKATGSMRMIEEAGENLRKMEVKNRFTFNIEKTN